MTRYKLTHTHTWVAIFACPFILAPSHQRHQVVGSHKDLRHRRTAYPQWRSLMPWIILTLNLLLNDVWWIITIKVELLLFIRKWNIRGQLLGLPYYFFSSFLFFYNLQETYYHFYIIYCFSFAESFEVSGARYGCILS